MKIESFLMLAEPEKLMYPYAESVESLAEISDKVTVRFASSRDSRYRSFEEKSFSVLMKLKNKYKDSCEIEIIQDPFWKYQKDQTYEELRSLLSKTLDESSADWFLKCDGDNIFQKNPDIRSFIDRSTQDVDCIFFPRINVENKDKLSINFSNRDIYAINLSKTRKEKNKFKIGETTRDWCRPELENKRVDVIKDPMMMPVNYDATFFDRPRIIDFWRKTIEVTSRYQSEENVISEASDEEVLLHFVNYKKRKIGRKYEIDHPIYIRERIKNLPRDLWGYDNFGMMR